eukprot:317471-Amphidinium_carterae.2
MGECGVAMSNSPKLAEEAVDVLHWLQHLLRELANGDGHGISTPEPHDRITRTSAKAGVAIHGAWLVNSDAWEVNGWELLLHQVDINHKFQYRRDEAVTEESLRRSGKWLALRWSGKVDGGWRKV